ncbi:phage major capsid protein [Methylophaga sp. OBS4]|uniref:phage major capsid protein n=1 Tax=Methylophaga sp. OBS4 TaxID=2991935 RepID=UPI00224DB2AA|nr:phage major capsid protein [Methylophaga sp. OBS4]MCX4186763.1 phage major capsid protein [Methylophaga sp. OBS4]
MGKENTNEPTGLAAEVEKELKGIQDNLNKKMTDLHNAIAKSEHEFKEHGKISDDVKNQIAELSKKQEGLETSFNDDIKTRLTELEQRAVRGKGGKPEVKSLGQMLIEHEGTKGYAEKEYHKGQSVPLQLKDITSGAASAGDGIWSFRDPELVSNPYRSRMMRTLIPTVPVDSNLVEWVQTNVRTNNAAAVSETGAKPKSELTYDRKETAVRKIAHYFKTSAEVLADFQRLRAEVDTEGFEMLRQEEEDQLLSGDGTGVNLLGMIPQATDYDTDLTQSGDTQVDVIRRSILQVRQSFYGATGIVLNPADWAAIELLKDADNAYLFSSARDGADARLWGLPVVESDAITSGQFMVGAFATAATIYDRMNAAVYLSTENEDDFIKNMVSILFEERLALAVKRPLAFVHGNLSGAS